MDIPASGPARPQITLEEYRANLTAGLKRLWAADDRSRLSDILAVSLTILPPDPAFKSDLEVGTLLRLILAELRTFSFLGNASYHRARPAQMDAVYLYDDAPDAAYGLKYSLRSLERHAPFIRKVWIFGERPHFLTQDSAHAEHVPHEALAPILTLRVPIRNELFRIVASSFIPDLLASYLLMADDVVLLRDLSPEALIVDRYRGNLAARHFEERWDEDDHPGVWMRALRQTFDTLQRLGFSTYDFETRAPTYLTRERVLQAYLGLRGCMTQNAWFGMPGRTAVLNHAYSREYMRLSDIEQTKSVCSFTEQSPSYATAVRETEHSDFLHFLPPAHGGGLEELLDERFPQPSRFEVSAEAE